MKQVTIPLEEHLVEKALKIADGMQKSGRGENLEASHIYHSAILIGLEVMFKRWYQADQRPTADLITEGEAELESQKRKAETQTVGMFDVQATEEVGVQPPAQIPEGDGYLPAKV